MSTKKKSGNGEWKIVIAEDSATQKEQLKYILETHGYQVVAASNGKEALALLRSSKPNLVISDIVMPEMDGYELCKQIKTDEKLKDIPVILLTALFDPADVIKGLECGADNFLTKPYDERILFSRIEYLRLNWRLPEGTQVQMGVEITFSGQKYFITSDRLQILNLLLSTYESAVGKNRELELAQTELARMNEQLEQRVKERTAGLVKANEELNVEITERKQAEERIEHLNAVLRAIRKINLLIVNENDRDRLIQSVCDIFTETRGYHNAWIALFDESMNFIAAAEAGLGENFSRLLEILERGDLIRCGREALDQSGVLATDNPPDGCGDCPLARDYEGRGAMTIRLEYEGKVYGILSVSVPLEVIGDKEERSLFEEAANNIAFALNLIESKDKERRSQEALRKSEEFNKQIIESSNDCIKTLDLDGRLEFMSLGGQELLEIEDIGPYLNQPWVDFWKDSDRKAVIEAISKVKEGDIGSFQGYCPTEKGTPKWWDVIITPITGKDNKTERLLAISRDITEHIQASKALQKSEEKYRTLVESSSDAILMMDNERTIVSYNQAFLDLFGYKKDELIGESIRIIHQSDESFRSFGEAAYPMIEKGGFFRGEWDFMRKDAAILPAETVTSVIKSPDGSITGYVATLRDITHRKKAEEGKKNLESQFIQSQKMEAIGTLAGGVAHDFNNLLTTIIGNSELSLMGFDKDDSLRENIEEVKKAANSAASLTRQLLAFSRKQVFQPVVLNLNIVAMNLEKMLKRLIGEDVNLKTSLKPDLGEVESDPGQIEQVIMNLAVNAKDAMPQGGKLTIETANVDLDENYFRDHGIKNPPGPYVMLAVSDTGKGMDKETQSRIFEPFFTTKEVGKGTGLGLSTVYGIIKQSNGFIWIYSEPGEGTTFKIYLPRVEKEGESVKKEIIPMGSLRGSETVLIVEDNDALRDLAREILQPQGYSILEAQSGEEALRVSEGHKGPIDLMITDVVMPGISGPKLAEALLPLRPDMKVLYMSGYTDDTIVHHGMLNSDLSFLQKPFSVEGLARKVREVLD